MGGLRRGRVVLLAPVGGHRRVGYVGSVGRGVLGPGGVGAGVVVLGPGGVAVGRGGPVRRVGGLARAWGVPGAVVARGGFGEGLDALHGAVVVRRLGVVSVVGVVGVVTRVARRVGRAVGRGVRALLPGVVGVHPARVAARDPGAVRIVALAAVRVETPAAVGVAVTGLPSPRVPAVGLAARRVPAVRVTRARVRRSGRPGGRRAAGQGGRGCRRPTARPGRTW